MNQGVQPVLTDSKRTGFTSSSRINDSSSYFLPQETDRKTPIQCIKKWIAFDRVVQENLNDSGLSSQNIPLVDLEEIALLYVAPCLKQLNIDINSESITTFPVFTGAESRGLVLTKGDQQTRIIGLYEHSNDGSESLPKFLSLSGPLSASQEYAIQNPNLLGIVKKLNYFASVLYVQGISLGYISTNGRIRFIELERMADNTCLINISDQAPTKQVHLALLAIAIKASKDNEKSGRPRAAHIIPRPVATPNVTPLSAYDEGSPGHIKWWVARKTVRQNIKLTMDDKSITGGGVPSGHVIFNNTAVQRASFILAADAPQVLHISASMSQFLASKKIKGIPQLIVYGQVLQFNILILQYLGFALTKEDMSQSSIQKEMYHILAEIHDQGVMLNSFSLSDFFIDRDENNLFRLQFNGFRHAKLYRRVPQIAREREQDILRSSIRDMMVN